MLSFPISNICQVASDLDDSAAGLDPKYALTLLLLDFVKATFNLSRSFFRDWYWPVTKKVGMMFKKKEKMSSANDFGQWRNVFIAQW